MIGFNSKEIMNWALKGYYSYCLNKKHWEIKEGEKEKIIFQSIVDSVLCTVHGG